jgi:hypothetical protein
MRTHFTIGYPQGFEQVPEWLRRRAADDPLLALGEGEHGEFYVVVAASEELARWAQEQLDADRLLPAGMGVIEVSTQFHTVRVNLECGDDESAVTAALIKDLLNQFPNYRVYDEDSGENITELVRADVNELFKSQSDPSVVVGE